MKELNENSTIEEVKDFLLFHMEEADDRKSKINPSLTKQQVWDVNMGAVMEGDITRVRTILIKNITREFGKHFE
jgi:hypothetical protein